MNIKLCLLIGLILDLFFLYFFFINKNRINFLDITLIIFFIGAANLVFFLIFFFFDILVIIKAVNKVIPPINNNNFYINSSFTFFNHLPSISSEIISSKIISSKIISSEIISSKIISSEFSQLDLDFFDDLEDFNDFLQLELDISYYDYEFYFFDDYLKGG